MEGYNGIRNLTVEESSGSPPNAYDVVVFSTAFSPEEKYSSQIITERVLSSFMEHQRRYLDAIFRILKEGGLLFVYGLPKLLPYIGEYLGGLKDDHALMMFKNWIALAIEEAEEKETLRPEHMGLLLYLKTSNTKSPSPFNLNTKSVRIPYKNCEICGNNVKDWGGKKHLLNPIGACISDVWADLPKLKLSDSRIPTDVLRRIYDLTEKEAFSIGYITEKPDFMKLEVENQASEQLIKDSNAQNKLPQSELNKVLQMDSLEYMEQLSKKFPEGVFDLTFADPPYNLAKDYSNYLDIKNDADYINWCERWLGLMARVTRPGGTLMVVNLPKWAIYHAAFLNGILNFRHWVVWDALSSPAGKIMPAHYALLYYTKPGGRITFNYPEDVESDCYCIRNECRKRRRTIKGIKKVKVTDIWWDIHRIKHKKDRDEHPCQLPINLMRRIIEMVTNSNDVVYDPFCGTGTTAISAKILKRNFITTEIDDIYVKIASANLSGLQPTLFDEFVMLRKPIKGHKAKKGVPRKEMEIKFIELCQLKKRVLDLAEIRDIDKQLFESITHDYSPSFKTLQKIAKRRLEIINSDSTNVESL